ncbi:MAG: PilW family protein [Gammaproteobacteria bacterium]|nr:PilW family protein [Gammaproteobacteria bacterium]
MSRNQRHSRRRQRGVTLVELLVATTVGLFLIGGVAAIVVQTKKSYELQNDFARIQENGRFGMELIVRDLRMAGYFGCMDDATKVWNHVSDGSGDLFDTSVPVEGYEQGGTAWQPSGSTDISGILNGTDGLTLRFLDPSTAIDVTTPYMPQPSGNIKVETPGGDNGLRQGDIIAVTDCDSTDVFQITGPSGDNPGTTGELVHNTGNATLPGNSDTLVPNCPGANAHCLSKVYEGEAQIMKLAAIRYFVGSTPQGSTALFRQAYTVDTSSGTPTAVGTSLELVEGIENMQVQFGVDNDGDQVPDFYRDAANVGADWPGVINVRVGLLAGSVNEYGTDDADTDDNTYDIDRDGVDDVVDPDDRRRRRVFTATVALRNAL